MTAGKLSVLAILLATLSLLVAIVLVIIFPLEHLSYELQDRLLLVFVSASVLFATIGVQIETGKASLAVILALAIFMLAILY